MSRLWLRQSQLHWYWAYQINYFLCFFMSLLHEVNPQIGAGYLLHGILNLSKQIVAQSNLGVATVRRSTAAPVFTGCGCLQKIFSYVLHTISVTYHLN